MSRHFEKNIFTLYVTDSRNAILTRQGLNLRNSEEILRFSRQPRVFKRGKRVFFNWNSGVKIDLRRRSVIIKYVKIIYVLKRYDEAEIWNLKYLLALGILCNKALLSSEAWVARSFSATFCQAHCGSSRRFYHYWFYERETTAYLRFVFSLNEHTVACTVHWCL